MTTAPPTEWVIDEQQESFLQTVFDVDVIGIRRVAFDEIDAAASQSIGQNRQEMTLDRETVEIIALYIDEGVKMPMPIVWKRDGRSKRYVVLDGNHRIAASRGRGDDGFDALLIQSETAVAQWVAAAVNLMHGRSVRDADYMATTMRLLHEQGLPIAQIARIYGMADSAVRLITKRDEQNDRLRALLPGRAGAIKAHTLDQLGGLEDAHVVILGDWFLDATRAQQAEIVNRIKATPSAERDQLAHEIVGELRTAARERAKIRQRETRPAGQLQNGLQRLAGVVDYQRAYSDCSDRSKATVRANLADVLPRLAKLWNAIGEHQVVG